MSTEVLLAVDPSLRGTGFAVMTARDRQMRVLESGTIKNDPKLTVPACLVAIFDKLTEVIAAHHPTAMAIETTIYVQSYQTAIVLGSARGAALLAAAKAGLVICEYAPRRVKQAVVGRGGAQKSQVGFMVRALLGLTTTPSADEADALAIGITHFQKNVVG